MNYKKIYNEIIERGFKIAVMLIHEHYKNMPNE
jgi:hypothetical protein